MRTILLMAALVGCSSSSDGGKDEGPDSTNTPPSNMPSTGTNTPAGNMDPKPGDTAKPPADTQGMTTPPPTTGMAGAMAPDPGKTPDPGMMVDPPDTMKPADGQFPDIRGVGCSVESGFPGDDICLAPPPAGEGMQLHVGPTDYKNMAEVSKFVFEPGQEASNCWTVKTPNTEEIYYQGSVLSGRPGTHHIINTGLKPEANLTVGGFTTVCPGGATSIGGAANANSLGALPGASKAYMQRRPVAPENAGLGRPIPAGSFMTADMHYFNFTDKPILREFWMNLYFIDKAKVTDKPNQIRCMGGFGYQIQPGTDMVYKYQTAPIMQPGRIIELLGHYHAHGKRFTAYIKRAAGGEPEKVFEMYNYLDPLVFDYNTITKNPPFSMTEGGAVSGMLEVKAGDIMQWECHIVNDSQDVLRYTNMVKTGEMCNLWGASVGTTITGYGQ